MLLANKTNERIIQTNTHLNTKSSCMGAIFTITEGFMGLQDRQIKNSMVPCHRLSWASWCSPIRRSGKLNYTHSAHKNNNMISSMDTAELSNGISNSCSTSPNFLFCVGLIWTPSLPWYHLKTTSKSAKFETFKPFCLLFRTGMSKDLHQNASHWK